jgi:hypothetical protein
MPLSPSFLSSINVGHAHIPLSMLDLLLLYHTSTRSWRRIVVIFGRERIIVIAEITVGSGIGVILPLSLSQLSHL